MRGYFLSFNTGPLGGTAACWKCFSSLVLTSVCYFQCAVVQESVSCPIMLKGMGVGGGGGLMGIKHKVPLYVVFCLYTSDLSPPPFFYGDGTAHECQSIVMQIHLCETDVIVCLVDVFHESHQLTDCVCVRIIHIAQTGMFRAVCVLHLSSLLLHCSYPAAYTAELILQPMYEPLMYF